MRVLICTVGLPRSGKTTWAREQGHPIVNPDSIRLALHGRRFVSLAEPFVWAIAKVMVRALFLAGHDVVILDACSHTRARREEWKSSTWQTDYVEFGTPVAACVARARQIGDEEIVPVILRMDGAYEPVESDE